MRLTRFIVMVVLCVMVNSCTAVSTPPPPLATKAEQADKIIVFKKRRILYLMQNGESIRKYRISVGKNPRGHKIKKGDQRTPEGLYRIINKKPDSIYQRSLQISYPNSNDIANAKKRKVNPGGNIVIHGFKRGRDEWDKTIDYYDWTDGCIRVSNRDLDEIWSLVPVGIPIQINP